LVDSLNGCLLYVLRRIEVGFTSTEADNIAAGRAQLRGQCQNGPGRRGFDGCHALGN
jgi:hypothetical protein